MQQFETFLMKLKEVKRDRYQFLEGYSEEEIADFFGSNLQLLPQVYIEFLNLMGRRSFFLNGQTYSMGKLEEIQRHANQLVKKNVPPLNLSEEHFVFLTNEGYVYTFFSLGAGEDPPVYGFAEAVNQQKFEKITDSLTEFFEKMLNDDITLYDPMFTYSTFPPHVYRQKEKAKSKKELYIPFDVFSKVKESFNEQEIQEVIDVLKTLYQDDQDMELMISCAKAILFLANGNIETVKALCQLGIKNDPKELIAEAERSAGNPGHGFSIPFDQIDSYSTNSLDQDNSKKPQP